MQQLAGLLLAPGAGGSRDSRALVAVEEALDLPVLRIDFPNRLRGSRAPDRPPAAITHLREQADAFAESLGVAPARVALGGRSFGGRMASMAVAQGQPAAALVLLSYPLHPPGKPDRLRTEHLTDIDVPVLAVSGTADPFGSPDELSTHLAAIAGPLTCTFVAGTHTPKDDDEVARTVATWLTTL